MAETNTVLREIEEEVIKLRQTLHRYPELSGNERQTAGWIKAFLEKQSPDRIIEGIGGYSLAAVYDSGRPGPVVLFRADIDALPIQEVNDFSHKSQHDGVSHKCGHDGHTAILAGLAMMLKRNKPETGSAVLLFQAEEETGQGAEKVINDPLFREIVPDYVFALHNLPGFKKGSIILREGTFASASKGMIIRLEGLSSHAAHPEQGNSPGPVLPEYIGELLSIQKKKALFQDFVLLTIIHLRLGEVAFGTNPGKATLMATLRTFLNDDMDVLTAQAEELVRRISESHKLKADISYTEVFPATHNHSSAFDILSRAAKSKGFPVIMPEEPFRWSEDFGHFSMHYPGALFGLGAGRNHPGLHNNDYDFPDDIISTGIQMFSQISRQLLNQIKDV
jgi:amidohydrolase